MLNKIPVGMLLRVSTTMQVSSQEQKEADIPTQRAACVKFIEQHLDWELTKEYIEIGVSGHKMSINQRDKLLEAQEDIRTQKIKVLVVFMFDRLGRIEDETPIVVQKFVKMGAEVWSVKEGQRKFDNHIDKLMNYITFWQADGESQKTSERVSNAMTVMAERGLYTGGRTPYGYKTVVTGRLTKKQLPEKTLIIDEDEAVVVRRAFDLALGSGFGCHRIAKSLNEAGIRNRNGNQWSHSGISNLLSNPIYMGRKAYNRTTSKDMGKRQKRLPPEQWTLAGEVNPDWIIVQAEDWEAVNRQKKAATQQQHEQQAYNSSLSDTVISRSQLLFGGFAYCGECGAKMSTGYSPYRWKTEDGIVHRKENPVYRCGARSSGKIGCTAKSSYQKHKVEDIVLLELRSYLDHLKHIGLSDDISDLQKKNTQTEEKLIKTLNNNIEKMQKEIMGLEGEIVKVISGESPFSRETLSQLLETKKSQLIQLKTDLLSTTELLEQKKIEHSDVKILQEVLPVWGDVFDRATVDEQKVLLSKIIERVDVSSSSIKIQLRLHVKEFIGLFEKSLDIRGKKRDNNLTTNCVDRVTDEYILRTFA